jgi:hypothetical protein
MDLSHLAERPHERISTDCEEAEAEIKRLRAALDEIRIYAVQVVTASDAYGETESAHLWQEVADIAEKALK